MSIFLSIFVSISFVAFCSFASDTNVKCKKAAHALETTARNLRKIYIPAVEQTPTGNTITGSPGCLVTHTGWWTYEFCFGDFIRQFHAEGGEIHDEYFIGLTKNVLDKTSLANEYVTYGKEGSRRILSAIKELPSKGLVSRSEKSPLYACSLNHLDLLTNKEDGVVVHSVYTGGSFCEAGQRARSATVYYMCDTASDSKQQLPIYFDISEAEPCVYRLFVKGDAMCSLMGLSPPPKHVKRQPNLNQKNTENQDGVTSKKKKKGIETSENVLTSAPNKIPQQRQGDGISNDGAHETFEKVPDVPKEDEVAPESILDEKKNCYYKEGLDDPAYFEDSFIMTV